MADPMIIKHKNETAARFPLSIYNGRVSVEASVDSFRVALGYDDKPQYQVCWPSMGRVSVDEARQFAAAINAACEWLETQKKEAGNG